MGVLANSLGRSRPHSNAGLPSKKAGQVALVVVE